MNWVFDPLVPLKYGALLVDPPWAYAMWSANGHAKSPEAHYNTMSLDALKALPVNHLAGPSCLIFMWSTWPHLPQALDLMAAWGFTFCTGGAWVKRTVTGKASFGTGYVLRSSTEPFLVGRLGKVKIASRSERNLIEVEEDISATLIDGLRREHSRKPPEMRAMIERLLPDTCCAELFAREPWPGHDIWGDQTDKFGGAL